MRHVRLSIFSLPVVGVPVFCMAVATLLLLSAPCATSAQGIFQVEGGLVFSGYNNVQVPRSGGTRFSLSDDLEVDSAPYLRLRIEWEPNARNTFGLLVAPLTLDASGSLATPLTFEGVTFPADAQLDASYTFNSYRLTWRRNFEQRGPLRTGLGFTAKIRDAAISLEGGGLNSEKTNVGFVPLLHFLLGYRVSEEVELLITGDALAAPQGRAEDVFVGILFLPESSILGRLLGSGDRASYFAGYRLVEGGADVDAVYNFALIHYVAFGVRITY
ncbi:hypothetical protein ACFL4Y_00925 [Gemmatimonadota bacterium]